MAAVERRDLIHHLASSIAALDRSQRTRVAIDGVDAAGKTTLADELAPAIEALGRPVIRASVDGFHNPAAVRRRRGPSPAEGYYRDSFDYEALIGELLEPLGPGGSGVFRRAVFDFRLDQTVESSPERAPEDAVLLLDGVFLLRPELRGYFELSIFLRVDFEVAVARAEERDQPLLGSVEKVRQRYRKRYVPGQRLYLAEAAPESRASVLVDNNDLFRPVVVRDSLQP